MKVMYTVCSMFATCKGPFTRKVSICFFFDLGLPIVENANVKCKHYHLPQNPFLIFDENANVDVTR